MTKRRIIIKPAQNESTCRSLVPVDSTRLKAQEQLKCQNVYLKVESIRKSVELHESKSVPEFQKWLHSCFGKQLTEIRELGQKLIEFQGIIESVEAQCFLTGCPPWKAYESVMNLKDKEEEHFQRMNSEEKEYEAGIEEEFFRSAFESLYGSKKQWRSRSESYEEAFSKFREEIKEDRAEPKEEPRSKKRKKNRNQQHPPQSSPSLEMGVDPNARLKEHYRTLARRLHPDLNPGLEPRMIDLWHQVQQAYDCKNLARLEALSALSSMYDQSWEKIEGIFTLKKLFRELTTTLKDFEKKLKLIRKDKSWNFHEKMNDLIQMKLFEREVERDLKSQKSEIKEILQEMEMMVDSWSNPSKKERRRKNSGYPNPCLQPRF